MSNEKMANQSICNEFALEVSDYIRNSLSTSEMERFSNHILHCTRCNTLLKYEKKIEKDLLKSTEEELLIHDIDDERMLRLEHAIMESIRFTPQEKSRTRLEPLEWKRVQKPSSGTIMDRLRPLFRNPVFTTAAIPAAFIIILSFVLFHGFEKESRINQVSKDSAMRSIAKLKIYGKTRSLSTLYGYNPINEYRGFICGLARDITGFNPSLQETILYNLEKLKFSNIKQRKKGRVAVVVE